MPEQLHKHIAGYNVTAYTQAREDGKHQAALCAQNLSYHPNPYITDSPLHKVWENAYCGPAGQVEREIPELNIKAKLAAYTMGAIAMIEWISRDERKPKCPFTPANPLAQVWYEGFNNRQFLVPVSRTEGEG